MSEHLKICSFNCEGVSRSTEYMNEFLSKYECDLFCLQETWLLNENLSKLGNIHDKYLYTGKSGVDSTRDILIGRPAGGVSILYHKSIAKYIECIDIAHPRLCSVILRSVSDVSILVTSVYMPCDNYSMTNVNTEFEEVISIIECTMHTHDCDAYILCGDFNTCFIRANAQGKCLNEFNERNNLLNAWESPIAHRGYTYTNYSLNHNSCIDYFFVTENVFDKLKECVVHYDPLNPSNHNVISLDYRCDSRNNVIRDRCCKLAEPRNAWYKATEDDIKIYQSKLDDLLDKICIPKDTLICRNVLCQHVNHINAIDKLCNDIIKSCLEAGHDSIPLKKSYHNSVPGWKDKVKPERDISMFWHWMWLECGKSNTGQVYEIMKKTRHKYHYAVRCAKKDEFNIKKQKLAENVHGETDLWKELKKINPTCRNVPTTIDDAVGPSEIAELFVSKYEQLYNSVSTSVGELTEISDIINKSISCDNYGIILLQQSTIQKCVNKLKSNKSDGNLGFDSDHLLNCTPKLVTILSLLFNAMIIHGHNANDLLFSTIVSIPKNMRSTLCSSSNYRGISLCSSICKVIDMAIMEQFGKYLYTSDLQFGFKPGLSTIMCTAVYMETVNYYTYRNTDVYSCLLDASSAFDKVHYGKLFKLLIKRKLPMLIVRLLFHCYTHQQVCVSWESCRSRYFGVSNGVKQGGVISPILFIIYIDELLLLLEKSGLGCHIGTNFCGVLGYADDLTLICPSLRALTEMISMCKTFANDFNVTFNAKKTVCIKFGSKVTEDDKLLLDGCPIKWKDQVKHLGNIVNNTLTDENDCSLKISSFNGSVNKLLGNYGGLQTHVLVKLFNSYCCSFYGSQMWTMNSPGFKRCCIQWNKAVRRILNLPYRTHTWLLGPLMRQRHIRFQFQIKFLRFIHQMLNSTNNVVSYVARVARFSSNTILGRNISYMRYKYDVNFNDRLHDNITRVSNTECPDLTHQGLINTSIDMFCARNCSDVLHGFTSEMIENILHDVCVN